MYGTTLFVALALAALDASANCIHGTHLQRRQLTEEGKVEVSNFSYSGEQGPLNWAALDPANSACRSSNVQSPIVLDNTVSKATEAPRVVIENVEEAEFENLGTTLETIVTGTTTFAGADFTLQQFHLHTPSEHRINEEYFPLEMHMVHEAADGSGAIAVIAIPFQLTEDGSTTELLTAVIQNIDAAREPGSVTTTGALDFTELINAIQTRPLFQYTGSLTTPPCAEGLTFLVMEEPMALNVATYNKLKAVIKFNARYSQNTLGTQNLLAVANEFAAREDAALCANANVGLEGAFTSSAATVGETARATSTSEAREAAATGHARVIVVMPQHEALAGVKHTVTAPPAIKHTQARPAEVKHHERRSSRGSSRARRSPRNRVQY